MSVIPRNDPLKPLFEFVINYRNPATRDSLTIDDLSEALRSLGNFIGQSEEDVLQSIKRIHRIHQGCSEVQQVVEIMRQSAEDHQRLRQATN